MAVFWVVALCSLEKFTDVSEVLAASIIGAIAQYRGGWTICTSATQFHRGYTTSRQKKELSLSDRATEVT
jgi:hypothetical protein